MPLLVGAVLADHHERREEDRFQGDDHREWTEGPTIIIRCEMGRPADKLLKASRVGFLTHRWKPFASFTELLARQDTHRGVKTLAVETPGGLVLVALRAADELDYGKLATLLGVDRGLITLAASSRTQETLGVAPGFETILTDADVTCVVDERVPLLGRVIVSGGVTDRLYELAPYDLVAVSGATVADVVEEPPRR